MVPLITAVGTVVTADKQKEAAAESRKRAEAEAKARQAELEMQLAAVREQTEAQQNMLKQVAIYGGAAVGGLMLIRGLTR